MGGRGASFGKSNGSPLDTFRNAKTIIFDDELKGMNMTLVNKTLKGVQDTLKEFGLPLSLVASIGVSMNSKAVASANGLGQLGLGLSLIHI